MKNFKNVLGFFIFGIVAVLLLPSNAFAVDNFDKLLTDGKLVVKSVKPTNIQDAWAVVFENTIMAVDEKYYLNWDTSFNDDFTRCTIYYGDYNNGDPSTEVEISYVYDNNVKTVVDSLVSKIADKDTFSLNEIEFINYLINKSDDASMANYSSELRRAIGYKNFSIDVRMGDDAPFLTEKGGNALFNYNGTTYYIKGMTSASAKHIIYVDDNVNDVLSAIKMRLVKNFGKDFDVVEKDTVSNFLASERQKFINEYDTMTWVQSTYSTAEEYATSKMNENYNNEDAYYHFVTESNVYEKYYTLTINGEEVNFLVIKDSSKVNDNIALITNDVASDITISAETSLIPLDTLIQVSKITSGDNYDKIVKLLKVTNSEMFDLKLYSNSRGNYITKLDNGKFEVKIPISNKLNDKNLIVYYVDENENVKTYNVIIDDGYATFETDHFSIYTLAEDTNSSIDTNDDTPNANTGENITPTSTSNTTSNPQTGDNILFYILMLGVSVIGIIGIESLRKKEN